jgi:hypothetical protein
MSSNPETYTFDHRVMRFSLPDAFHSNEPGDMKLVISSANHYSILDGRMQVDIRVV